MLLRNGDTGGLEVYDIANNQITNAAFIGTVGRDWVFSGLGNFSGVDLLLRNVNTGGLEVYNINNNQLTGAAFLGTIGLDWQFAALPRSTPRARPTWCCVTSTPAHSRCTTSLTTRSRAPRCWAQSAWTGRLAVLPSILPRSRAHSRHLGRSACAGNGQFWQRRRSRWIEYQPH
jgi:hypothetical protein